MSNEIGSNKSSANEIETTDSNNNVISIGNTVYVSHNYLHLQTITSPSFKVNADSVRKQPKYQCMMCIIHDVGFASSTTLCDHLKSIHRFQPRYICQFCDQEFFSQTHIFEHLSRAHLYPSMYSYLKCPFCQKQLCDVKLMDSHLLAHYYAFFPNSRPFLCSGCETTSFGIQNFLKHFQTHYIVCGACHWTCETPQKFFNHYKSMHSNDIKCGFCDKKIVDVEEYLQHLKSHDVTIPKPLVNKKKESWDSRYLCFVCDEFFSSRETFLTHYMSEHGNYI